MRIDLITETVCHLLQYHRFFYSEAKEEQIKDKKKVFVVTFFVKRKGRLVKLHD